MTRCLHAHAAHPDWRMALALVAAQIDAQRHQWAASPALGGPYDPTLGMVYFSDRYAAEAEGLLADLRQRWPGVSWVGGSGIGVAASGVEYFDEPALALMMLDLPPEHFRLFTGTRPLPPLSDFSQAGSLGARQWTALVHADPQTPDLAAMLPELAQRTGAGFLFGGLVSGREATAQLADGVFHGGLSGVAFHQDVPLLSRVTQGCQPIGPRRRITACERNVVLGLDGAGALPALMADLALDREDLRLPPGRTALSPAVMQRLRTTLVGLSADNEDGWAPTPGRSRDPFGADTWVRHLIGLDPAREGVALADAAEPGLWMTFCRRDSEAARRDLLRIGAEIRDEVSAEEAFLTDSEGSSAEPWRLAASHEIAGAVYVSCVGRGGPHFGGASAELQWLRHALGDVPLVGFFANGEIAHDRLYGYTGVLTVFLREAP